ncbi:hypothetical protein SDC9_145617 [bioreactor metagenome]|uniref:Uncharacterized protein n=1 Tax=bioreactor metagenome TaxID=1076179 RepID=A0A645EAJ4_9ZZZZ
MLGHAEHPVTFLRRQIHRRQGQQRGLGFDRDFGHGQRVGHGGRTDQDIDLVFINQLLGVLGSLGRIGRIVEQDVVHLLAGNGGRQQGQGVLLRRTQS